MLGRFGKRSKESEDFSDKEGWEHLLDKSEKALNHLKGKSKRKKGGNREQKKGSREAISITQKERQSLQNVVVESARKHVVAAKILDAYGPIGAGNQVVENDLYFKNEPGCISLHGDEISVAKPDGREYLTIPIIYKDFVIYWRDVKKAHSQGNPIDFSVAASAATDCAIKEDDLIFNGSSHYSIPGLLNVEGRKVHYCGNWDDIGVAFNDIVAAKNKLISAGHPGPFTLVLSPNLYAKLTKVHKKANILEIDHIKEIVQEGIYQTPVITGNQGVLLAAGKENMDIVVAADLNTVFLNNANLNYYFRVYECLVPRIKRPSAICALNY